MVDFLPNRALSGDGKENEEPNPDELADPMTDDEFPTEGDEDPLTPVNTDDEDPFDTEIGGDEDELPTNDEEEINPEEPIDFEDGEDLEVGNNIIPQSFFVKNLNKITWGNLAPLLSNS